MYSGIEQRATKCCKSVEPEIQTHPNRKGPPRLAIMGCADSCCWKLQQKKSCQKWTRPRIFSTYFLETSFELEIQNYQVCGRIADKLVEVKDHHSLSGSHCRTALPIIIKLILITVRCSWNSDHWQKFLDMLGNVVLMLTSSNKRYSSSHSPFFTFSIIPVS